MLTINEIANSLPARILAGKEHLDRIVSGGYACDLLSLVVSKIEEKNVWLTVLGSINVVAVATLAECPCVLLTENGEMDEEVITRANEKSLVVMSTAMTTFEAAAAIDRLLRREENDLPL